MRLHRHYAGRNVGVIYHPIKEKSNGQMYGKVHGTPGTTQHQQGNPKIIVRSLSHDSY